MNKEAVMNKEVVMDVSQMQKHAEELRNTDPHNAETMEVGDEWRQGDLRIVRLPDDYIDTHMSDLVPTEPNAKLVSGTSTGSNHILSSVEGATFYRLKNGNALDGPLVKLDKAGNGVLHPSHGDLINLPAGCWAFTGQRAFAEELRRVAD